MSGPVVPLSTAPARPAATDAADARAGAGSDDGGLAGLAALAAVVALAGLAALATLLVVAGVAVADVPEDFLDADRARDSYHAFLELAPADDPRRADALRRLADLELERAEELLLAEGLGAATDTAYREAIRLYDELLAAFPDRPQGDVVLYQLARAHDQRGDADAAVEVLGRLVRGYPDSALRDEAFFRRGEAFFLRREFERAAEAYAAVIDYADASTFFDQALYKHGWSQFRETRYEEALASFWTLAGRMLAGEDGYAPRAEDALSRPERELLDDTLRAMSVSFSYLDGVASLGAFFAGQTPLGFEHLVYAGLGDLYLGQERYNDAAGAYDAFSVAYPGHREAPVLQLKVIDTYVDAGFTAEVLTAKQAFAERYALTAPFWSQYPPGQLPDVVAALKTHLTDLTEYYHARAQAGAEEGTPGAAEDYATATLWYRRWLESFPADEETPGKRFLLAELLFERGRFDEAVEEYERTAYEYGDHARAAEAGYAALLAYDAHAEGLQGIDRDGWRRLGVDSAQRFAAAFPAHEQAVAVQTRAAEDLFAFAEYAAAVEAATRVTAWEDAAAVSAALERTAWTVIGHAQFELADYLQAERAYQKVLLLQPAADVEAAMVERLAASVYRQGEAHRDAGDLESAVEDFQRVADVAPSASIVATADYDAAAALVQLEAWDRATDALETFRARHPGHELAASVTRNLATAYLATGDATGAAQELERIARSGEEPVEVRIDAAWNAAEQFEKADDDAAALRSYAYLVDELPVDLDGRVDAQERIAELHGRRGELGEQLDALARLIDIDREAAGGGSERSRSAAAGAALRLADVERESFERIALTQPLQDSLAAKQRAMKRTLDAYELAADYGIAGVSTAAAYRVADLYVGLGRALMASERPDELDELALEQYEFLLEEQAFPFEEQGIDLHVANAARTADGVYDEWIEASFARLAELVPARYAKPEKGETLVTYIE